jgi:hypothetical protein
VKKGDISAEMSWLSIATQRILVCLRMSEREEKEGLKLQNLHTDHVTIRSELTYITGARNVDEKCRAFGGNPVQRSGSDSEPAPELNRDFGPIANTTYKTNTYRCLFTAYFNVLPSKDLLP